MPVDITQITAATGSEIVLQLPAAPGTGFKWEPSSVPPGIELVGRSYEPRDKDAIGGPGTQTFKVRITAGGTYDLVFELKRPWEGQAAQARTFHITTSP